MTDEGFLKALLENPHDNVTRLVYADWLDEHDDPRAEFLRLEVRFTELVPDSDEHAAVRARLMEMRPTLDPAWLARFDQTRVDNCPLSFEFECPRRWEQLHTTADARVRFCDSCHKEVHHCQSIPEARDHACKGYCVAVDSRITRQPGDLEERRVYVTMGIIAPEDYDMGDSAGEERMSEEPRSRRRWWQIWNRSR